MTARSSSPCVRMTFATVRAKGLRGHGLVRVLGIDLRFDVEAHARRVASAAPRVAMIAARSLAVVLGVERREPEEIVQGRDGISVSPVTFGERNGHRRQRQVVALARSVGAQAVADEHRLEPGDARVPDQQLVRRLVRIPVRAAVLLRFQVGLVGEDGNLFRGHRAIGFQRRHEPVERGLHRRQRVFRSQIARAAVTLRIEPRWIDQPVGTEQVAGAVTVGVERNDRSVQEVRRVGDDPAHAQVHRAGHAIGIVDRVGNHRETRLPNQRHVMDCAEPLVIG